METKKSTSVWLSDEAKRLLTAIAYTLGISKSACLQLAIRDMAKKQGLK